MQVQSSAGPRSQYHLIRTDDNIILSFCVGDCVTLSAFINSNIISSEINDLFVVQNHL